ncbi:MAG TPA: hypothetical protein VIU16_07600 [Gaiellaceae bacterium]
MTLLRNATLLVELAGRRILVDPMLGPVGSYPPIENTPGRGRIRSCRSRRSSWSRWTR